MKLIKNLFKKRFSLESMGLYDKSALAFFFIFIIPLLLTCYLLFVVPQFVDDKEGILEYSRVIVLLIIVCGLFGSLFLRRTIVSLKKIMRDARQISRGGERRIIEVGDDKELKDLATSFNIIDAGLEAKVRELEYTQNITRELFQQIGQAIASGKKIETLFAIINHGTRKVLGASSSFIALYENNNILRVKGFSGRQKNFHDNMKLSDHKGIIGYVVTSSKTLAFDDSSRELYERFKEDEIHYESSVVCVPIVIKSIVKGVLCVTDKSPLRSVGPEDISLLENMSNQIAICLENMELNKDIEQSYYNTLVMLARIVEAKDPYSAGHLERVSSYVGKMADKVKLDEESKKVLIGAALLHDLGKVGIEDAILKKKGVLSPEEYEVMKQHSVIGENILKPLQSMSRLSSIVRHHHEFFNGTGYPDGLKGAEIPLAARILTIVDIYDAVTTDRSYRKGMDRAEAIALLKSYAGNKLDPELVDIFIKLVS